MSRFVVRREVESLPRAPLLGTFDLTYRCPNDCRHCWLRLAPGAEEAAAELSTDEVRRIVDEARALGCREWAVSGGEPMLRPDFAEIFDHMTARAAWYTLNTNGTLITPPIARMLRRRGTTLVALYGATAAVHDAVTRRPGSFKALGRGVAYLREAGAAFTVQIVPLRTNIGEYEAMVRLALSWSPSWRLGATWLYLSASGDPVKNAEIAAERLDPAAIVALDQAGAGGPPLIEEDARTGCPPPGPDGLYAACLAGRRDFHVDPYGRMSFCSFVKDPALRVDLRATAFAEAWEERLPRLASAVPPSPAYLDGCGSCELRSDCRWCPVYAYLETGDHSAPIEHLCAVARETRRAREEWRRGHRRRFRVAGLAVDVEADRPIDDATFAPKFEAFRADGDGPADIVLRHHFALPDLAGTDLGREVRRRPPWAVHRKGRSWIYLMIGPGDDRTVHRVMVFDDGHTRGRVFSPSDELFRRGGHDSLALLPSDQIVLARALPAFGGVFVHAAAVDWDGRGLLFAGPSEAGKSTIVKLIGERARVLCDDRVVVRASPEGFRVHGTWNHGEIDRVSPGSAPLRAVFFLRQADLNRADRIGDARAVLRDFLPRLVRPLVSAGWWEKALAVAGAVVREVPFYDLRFDLSGAVVDLLAGLPESPR